MLALDRVSKTYPNGVEALARFSAAIRQGEILAIIGGSGCGKSTLLRAIAGLDRASSGTVTLDSEAISSPHAKIGIIYQNDDFGRDVLKGFKDGLGAKTSSIVAELSYETSDPTIDSQVVRCKSAGANVFMSMTTPKFAAQGIKKVAELNWQPTHYIGNNASSAGSTLKAAGFDISKGIISTNYGKDPADPQWKDDPGVKAYFAFMDKYYPEGDKLNTVNTYGYSTAELLIQVLKQCGDNLTRENLMKQAASLNFEIGIYLPGTKIRTGPDDYAPIEQLQMMRFKGESWERFGPIMSGEKNS